MKIAILGPVITPIYFGGVATFDEGLAQAFRQLGHDVTLFTTQKQKGFGNSLVNIRLVSKWCLAATVNRYCPDLVIASLQYALCFPWIHNGKKVLFLHGFFNFQSYGILKTLFAVEITKFMTLYSDKILANSNFTATINRRIWNIPVDGIVHLGVDNTFLEKVLKSDNTLVQNRGQILFAGRLVISKNIDKIIRALILLKQDKVQYNFVIAGDGPECSYLMNLAQQYKIPVDFLGRIEHQEIYKLYQKSEVFISLGESESFGLTYVESLLCNCKIVCPRTGGQVEFLNDYADRVSFVDPLDDKNIAMGIKKLLLSDIIPLNISKVSNRFSYQKTAQKIIEDSSIKS